MTLLQELLGALDTVDPAKAAQLRAEIASGIDPNAPPPAPPTLLDDLREDGHELSPGEIPNPHEVPVLLGVLVHELLDLTDRVAELESAADSGQVVTPAPAPVPAGSEPAPAPAADPPAVPVAPEPVIPPLAAAPEPVVATETPSEPVEGSGQPDTGGHA